MDFKTAMEHYRQGCADEAERALVEEELEKARLISEYLDQGWELEEAPQEDLTPVKKRLRRRSAGIVLTSLVLAAALLWGCVSFILPAWEEAYWDPRKITVPGSHSDLELTFAAYAELFCPDYNVYDVTADKTGFAAYTIVMRYWDTARGGDILYQTGTVEKGELTLADQFWDYGACNVFRDPINPIYAMDPDHIRTTREKLETLPEYIQVRAAISFPADKDMEALIAFRNALPEGYLGWVGIRTTDGFQQGSTMSGMAPFVGGAIREEINALYPHFEVKALDMDPEALEQHFVSLLTFSRDQYNAGTGLAAVNYAGDAFYREALAYIGEHGVYAYGGYLTASPQTLLDLWDSGAVTQVWIEDMWIG